MMKFKSLNIGFDALRGIAALLIFLFHFWQLTGFGGDVVFFSAGHIALDMFFVLSGFLIFCSLDKHGVNKKYFVRRMLRIMPLYYFSIILVALLSQGEAINGMKDLLYHLFFVQSFSLETYYGINPVLWSLSVEMIFYLFLPLMFLWTGSNKKRVWSLVLMMLVLCYVYRFWVSGFYELWNGTERIVYTENFIGRLDHFAWGILAALLVKGAKGKVMAVWKEWGMFVMAIAMIFVGMFVFDVYGGSFRDLWYLQVFLHSLIAAGTALLLYVLALSKRFNWLLGGKLMAGLGTISYSFYVWHFLLIQFAIKLLPELNELLLLLVSFVLIVGFSIVTYLFVERPFLVKKRY